LILLSRSSTALISFAAVAAMFPLLKLLQNRPKLIWPRVALGVILAVPLILTFAGGLDPALESFGKDSSLSGRTKLWMSLTDAIMKKPLQGYGYDAYLGSQGSEWKDTVKKLGWLPVHAHSGYIQIALSTGLLGLGIFVAFLTKCVVRALAFARANQGTQGLFPLALLIYLILHNVTETTFLQSSGLANILLFAIFVSMWIHPRLRRNESLAESELPVLKQSDGIRPGSLPVSGAANSSLF